MPLQLHQIPPRPEVAGGTHECPAETGDPPLTHSGPPVCPLSSQQTSYGGARAGAGSQEGHGNKGRGRMLSQRPQWKLVALLLWVGHLSMTWFVSGVSRVMPHPARHEPFLTLSERALCFLSSKKGTCQNCLETQLLCKFSLCGVYVSNPHACSPASESGLRG